MFSPLNELFIFVRTDCFLVKVISYCLNPSIVLNFYVAVILQSMITLIANSLCINILLKCCNLVCLLLVHIFVFDGMKDILLYSPISFYDLILLLYVIYSISVFHRCLLLFLQQFFHMLLCLYHRSSRIFYFLSLSYIFYFYLIIFFSTFFIETNSS